MMIIPNPSKQQQQRTATAAPPALYNAWFKFTWLIYTLAVKQQSNKFLPLFFLIVVGYVMYTCFSLLLVSLFYNKNLQYGFFFSKPTKKYYYGLFSSWEIWQTSKNPIWFLGTYTHISLLKFTRSFLEFTQTNHKKYTLCVKKCVCFFHPYY